MILKAESLVTEEQKKQFIEQGYCVVGGLFTETEIQDIQDFFEDFKTLGAKGFDGKGYEEVDPTKYQLRAMHPHRYDKRVVKWFLNPNVASALEVLLDKPALGVQTMYYFKPPG